MLPSDPFMLLSYVNMKLRDSQITPEELCYEEGIERSELDRRLGEVGFEYLPEVNQYR